jgi:hypothetical protein
MSFKISQGNNNLHLKDAHITIATFGGITSNRNDVPYQHIIRRIRIRISYDWKTLQVSCNVENPQRFGADPDPTPGLCL